MYLCSIDVSLVNHYKVYYIFNISLQYAYQFTIRVNSQSQLIKTMEYVALKTSTTPQGDNHNPC